MASINGKNYITPDELQAAKIGLSKAQQWILRKSGKLRFLKVGKRILYTDSMIAEYLEGCEIKQTAKAA